MSSSAFETTRLSKRRRETCPTCKASVVISSPLALQEHQASSSCQIVHCDICHMQYPFLNQIEHGTMHLREAQPLDTSRTSKDSLVMPTFVVEEEYQELYIRHEKYIKPYRLSKKLSAVYNFQLNRLSVEEIKKYLFMVFQDQSTAFKLKVSLAFILRNNEDQSLHFYYSSQNNQLLFNDPFFVGNLNDLHKFSQKIDEVDLVSHVHYPSSKFTFVRITNVTFFLSRILRCPIGAARQFPDHLKNVQGLYSLVADAKTGAPFTDKLCFFRCLALFKGSKITALERKTKELFKEYITTVHLLASEFEGIALDELENVSKIFKIGIQVFSKNTKGVTEQIFRTLKLFVI